MDLKKAIKSLNEIIGSKELKWKALSGPEGMRHIKLLSKINYKIYITVSSPSDIDFDKKYRLLRNFTDGVENMDFGKIKENLKRQVKSKVYESAKHLLFLNYYEKIHIVSAVESIESLVEVGKYNFLYKIDPPQANKKDWENMMKLTSDVDVKFPKSHEEEGIQFADVYAGVFKSLILKDSRYSQASDVFETTKDKMIKGLKRNPKII